MAAGSPYTDKLSFILTGNPNNPDGGLWERFVGAHVPGLDLLFNGATPPNAPYHIQIFTNQYDAVSDFPEYPLNVVSDTNAVFGFLFGAHHYAPYAPLFDSNPAGYVARLHREHHLHVRPNSESAAAYPAARVHAAALRQRAGRPAAA